MGSGIKMSVLLFSFALISAISIDDLPVKPAVVIDEKSVEYKLDDLNIIQPMFFVIPKDRNESFVGPPEHNERKLLEDIELDAEEYDDENTGSRRLLKKAKAPSPAPAPKKAPAPAPAPKPVVIIKLASAPKPVVVIKSAPAPKPVVVIKSAPAPKPVVVVKSTPAPKPVVIVKSTPLVSKFDNWLNTDKGKEAVDFCKSLGILNNNRVYMGCLEDMMVIKDKNIAKESALVAEEVISSDHEGTNRRFCQASGDPHVTNYDGSYFHIQEQGIYTVAKTDGFEVQEKMVKNGANKVGVPSCMTGAVVKSGSVIIEVDVYNYKKVVVNGESVDIPEGLTKTFGGVQVKYGKQTIEWKGQKATATGMKIITKNGFMVMIQGSYCGVLEVNVPISYFGKMSGICGNADGNKNGDDFCGSDGKVIDVNYGKSNWEMSGYGGPTAPLSKWQLSWKPIGSSCYFVSGCESATSSSIPTAIRKAPSPEPVVPSKPVAPVVPKTESVAPVVPKSEPVVPSKPIAPVVPSKPVAPVAPKKNKEDKTSIKVEQIIKDMKENHQLSTDKIKSLKTNVFKLINNEQKKLESELSDSKKIVLLTDNDVKKLKEKYENKIKEYRKLNQTISTLEQKMKEHYQQMDSDSKYLLLLEKIKPSFMGTLQSFGKIALNVKNTIVNNVVEGVDKEYMLRVLYEMSEPAKNSTSVLSTEFIKHYEKYKRRIGVDKDVYEKEYNELLVFREKYKSERKLKNLLLKDYKNALSILDKLRTSYMLDEEDIKEFEKLSIFIKNIFDYKKC